MHLDLSGLALDLEAPPIYYNKAAVAMVFEQLLLQYHTLWPFVTSLGLGAMFRS